MEQLARYQEPFITALRSSIPTDGPRQLYEPIRYILEIGGKRVRPMLTLMSAEIFGASFQRALPAALAVEVFHNFSLVHDDIMDQAPLRRGQETVHLKWDTNTAILSGDAMLILAYRHFESYEPAVFCALAKLFSKTAIEVCEGQQLDVDYGMRGNVSEADYLEMIRCKTAVLLGAALKMGAIVAGASRENCDAIYDFGVNLGMAFQIQDDLLDAFGDPLTFGKQVGGDILENKKTYLYIKASEFASEQQKLALDRHFSSHDGGADKIKSVTSLFFETGADKAAENAIRNYTTQAFGCMERMQISDDAAGTLRSFGERMMLRKV